MTTTETFEREKLYGFAAEFLEKIVPQRVLDIACGDGSGTIVIGRRVKGSVTGLDLSADLIEKAKSLPRLPNIEFVSHDARATDFSPETFDAIVSFHTIEHLDEADQRKFLGELKRVIKKGGQMLLATPDREVWFLQGIAGIQEDHIRELSRRECAELIVDAGFKIKAVYGQDVLKEGSFPLRRILNFLKLLDVFHLRRVIFSERMIQKVDDKTHPVYRSGDVVPLKENEKASITIFACEKV